MKVTAERNEAFSLLREDYVVATNIDPDSVDSAAAQRRQDRRSMVTELIGEGYDFSRSQKTFRRHKALALAQIKQIAGPDNTLRQQELAQALLDHYKAGGAEGVEVGSIDYTAHVAVIDGVVEVLKTLKKRNRGRYTREDRITQQVLLSAVVCKAGCEKVQRSIARLLQVRPQSIAQANARMEDAKKEERPYFFIDDETSCNAYDPAWAAFVSECWDNLTRASECTSDEAKDPKADENGNHMTHRIHWINHRLDDLLPIMLAMGKAEFGASFKISRPTMLNCKKHYHRYPGRNTCLCRYHMEFDHHFNSIRRWKANARRQMTTATIAAANIVEMPGSAKELRQFLMCERSGEYYNWDCAKRKCDKCRNNLEKLFTSEEKLAAPCIKYQKWTEIPYKCKDGRELKNFDFLPDEMKIDEYIAFLDKDPKQLHDFLPHHNRSKFLDNDWKLVYDDISKVDENIRASEEYHVEHWWELPESEWLSLPVENRIASIVDYANSYESEHKDEHMQQFWSHQSTTLLGNCTKIPIQLLNDKFFEERAEKSRSGLSATEERMEALRVCAENKLPPEVVVMHFGITSNPHHDTAGIQHYFKHNLYPWLKKYTNSAGALHIVRSDGCSGQMKSGRHFRWISNFHTEDWNLDHIFVWTHSESAHGKDRVDSECGRCKYILRCHEMRDTPEHPTQLKSSREQYDLLSSKYSVTRRTMREKKGKGTYFRVFHWMPAKSIRPLSSLAEVNTLAGSVTMKSHFFRNNKQTGSIDVREIACLNCSGCRHGKWRRCENTAYCGHMLTKPVTQKSGAREHAADTRSRRRTEQEEGKVQQAGLDQAKEIEIGMVVGAECTNETEPFIVCAALSSERVWSGEDGSCWMGSISEGMQYIRARKYRRGVDELMYSSTDCEFNLSSEDVRVANMEHKPVEVRRSSRASVVSNVQTITLVRKSLEKLKNKCCNPLDE